MIHFGRLVRVALLCAVVGACGDDNGTNNGGGDDSNTLTATIDGAAFTANSSVTATQLDGTLTITGLASNNRGIKIELPQVTQAGTYDTGPGFGAIVTYNIGLTPYKTSVSGGSGTVTVTSYSSTRVAGTFAVTTVATGGSVGNRVITNGKFNVKF
ncbi:MAG: DUF6252 family protein [Gemmatimonadales bacterium]